MLGGFSVRQGSRVLDRFATRQAMMLLATLSREPLRHQPREILIEMLWPGVAPDTGRHRLRQALTSLRRQLEPPGIPGGGVLVASRNDVGLRPDAVSTDVAEFVSACARAHAAKARAAQTGFLAEAVGLYAGDLLPGWFADWVVAERERLYLLYLRAAARLATLHCLAGAEGDAVDLLLRILATDTDEQQGAILRRFRGLMDRIHSDPADYRRLEQLLRQSLSGRRPAPSSARREDRSAIAVAAAGPVPSVASSVRAVLPASVPQYATTFHGREAELGRIVDWYARADAPRLLCLLGPGGAGKTRLAAEATERIVRARTAAGTIVFVPLASLASADDVPRAIALAAGLPVEPGIPPIDSVLRAMAIRLDGGDPSRGLIVLDNYEHLADDAGVHVRALLRALPALRILVTSRRRPGIGGESILRVGSLPLPDAYGEVEPAALLACASVGLYVDRMRKHRPDFAVTARNAEAVRLLCHRLEGLPLAIELAAGWGRTHAPARMLADMEVQGDPPATRSRDGEPRHASLRKTIDWSLALLSPRLRDFFPILGIFRGGFTAETLGAVVPAMPRAALVRSLRELEDHSLVGRADPHAADGGGRERWVLAESLRRHAEDLPRAGDDDLRVRHARAMAHLLEEARARFESADQLAAVREVGIERENIRGAMEWAGTRGDRLLALRIAVAAWPFWELHSNYTEARRWLEESLRGDEGAAVPLVVRARIGLGILTCFTMDFRHAALILDRAIAEARALAHPDPGLLAEALLGRGLIAWNVKETDRAAAFYAEALSLAYAAEDAAAPVLFRDALLGAAKLAVHSGAIDDAVRLQDGALSAARTCGAPRGILSVLLDRGMTSLFATRAGSGERGEESLTEALALCETIGDRYSAIRARWGLAEIALQRRGLRRATDHLARCLRETIAIGHRIHLAYCLESFATLHAARRDGTSAARLLGTAAAIREGLGFEARLPHERARHERLQARARALAGDAAFARSYAKGRLDDPDRTARALL